MDSDSRWRRVAKASAPGRPQPSPLRSRPTRYVLVYLTSLPKEGTDYRGGINEVAISQ